MSSLNRTIAAATGLLLATSVTATAQTATSIVISQYYEGTSNNKFIELWNPTATDIPLAGMRITLWSNAARENWKTGTGTPTASFDLGSISPGIVLKPGQFLLLGNASATVPAYAAANADAKPNASGQTVINFNGDDSVVLYSSDAYLPENILDAFSVSATGTAAPGNATDKTFYRLNAEKGFGLELGNQYTDFPAVWAVEEAVVKTLADVETATESDPWRLQHQPDSLPPTLETFTIANDAAGTPTPVVALTYTTSGGNPLEYQVSTDPAFTGADWLPYAPSVRAALTGPPGQKTLYFRVRNAAGPSATLSDSIELTTYTYSGTVLITQYYEGAGNAKFLEITNTSATEVDLATWNLVRWTNQNAEDYKVAGATAGNPSQAIPLTGVIVPATGTTILPAGGVIVLANNLNDAPPGGTTAALTSGNLSHNGNDSYALYNGPVSPENLVDAVGFTNLGNEGADKCFVRVASGQGFSFADASSVLTFPTVWQEVPLPDVAAAVLGQNNHLGTYPGGGLVGYDLWVSQAFPGVNDTDITGFTADPDLDGAPNGVEYYTGGNPNGGGSAISSVTGGAGGVTLTYNRSKNAPGVTPSWRWSTDMQSWFGSGDSSGGTTVNFLAPTVVDSTPPTFEVLSTVAEVTGTPAGRLYFRLQVTRP